MPQAGVSPRVVRLILKALDGLDPSERSEVLEQLVARGLAGAESGRSGPPSASDIRALPLEFALPIGAAPAAAEQRMFPVRLLERDHARLKAWCDAHSFPMAVVVRGLVERFLDRQDELNT
jgi:hypothetical protein